MSGLEFNKVAASVLVAGIAAMAIGVMTDILYHPETKVAVRGFSIEVKEAVDNNSAAENIVEKIDIGQLMAKADANKGKDDAQKCAVCHNFVKGAGAKVGPDLWGVVQRAKASITDYTYSKAMISKGGNWGYEDLYHFLRSPRKFVPGTKMGFGGFNKQEDAINVIAYLRSLDDNLVPLPPVKIDNPVATPPALPSEKK
jgi:cytochrome c